MSGRIPTTKPNNATPVNIGHRQAPNAMVRLRKPFPLMVSNRREFFPTKRFDSQIEASEIKFRSPQVDVHANLNAKTPQGAVTLELPPVKPDVEVPVVELFL